MKLPSGQTLAYLGDAVYELMLREHFIEAGIDTPEKLHLSVAAYTHAKAQADAYLQLASEWTEEEKDYFKLGRNAPISKKSRSVSTEVAHQSTGFEAIFGVLYLQNERARIRFLCQSVLRFKKP
jgi:ribonuclease-3 family protein